MSAQVTGGLTALSLWSDNQLQEAIMKDPTVHGGVYTMAYTFQMEECSMDYILFQMLGLSHKVAEHCHSYCGSWACVGN